MDKSRFIIDEKDYNEHHIGNNNQLDKLGKQDSPMFEFQNFDALLSTNNAESSKQPNDLFENMLNCKTYEKSVNFNDNIFGSRSAAFLPDQAMGSQLSGTCTTSQPFIPVVDLVIKTEDCANFLNPTFDPSVSPEQPIFPPQSPAYYGAPTPEQGSM